MLSHIGMRSHLHFFIFMCKKRDECKPGRLSVRHYLDDEITCMQAQRRSEWQSQKLSELRGANVAGYTYWKEAGQVCTCHYHCHKFT